MVRQRRPSPQTLKLLTAMAARAPDWSHGYELMKATGLLSGTLYPLLMRLAEQGIVESEWREPAQLGRPPRHAYRLTAAGIAHAGSLADGAGDSRLAPA
jgi:PadR family transcriptional regulator, regulatory protein PadR